MFVFIKVCVIENTIVLTKTFIRRNIENVQKYGTAAPPEITRQVFCDFKMNFEGFARSCFITYYGISPKRCSFIFSRLAVCIGGFLL